MARDIRALSLKKAEDISVWAALRSCGQRWRKQDRHLADRRVARPHAVEGSCRGACPPRSASSHPTRKDRDMNFLYHAHSGLRYLVLLAALAAVIALAWALATARANRATRILPAVFTGLLDLQVLLGIGLVIGGLMPDIVVGHLFMMVPPSSSHMAHPSSPGVRRASGERSASGSAASWSRCCSSSAASWRWRNVFGSAPMTVGLHHAAASLTSG